jgi:hypothetical protein
VALQPDRHADRGVAVRLGFPLTIWLVLRAGSCSNTTPPS